ncbi:MAG: multicopper oxidase domain-containing protein, partial [Thermomicrobiales bacterium]
EQDLAVEGVVERQIGGEEMDMDRIDVVVPAGAIEIWEVRSNGQPHTFHIHGASYHVLDVDGQPPPPHLRGPKDTVLVSPGHPVRLAVQFVSHIDPDVPFMYHCHLLLHEDNGMMGQFVIVEPGMEAVTSTTLDSGQGKH